MKAVVAAFNQEKALVGAFSVITNLRMELFEALVTSVSLVGCPDLGAAEDEEWRRTLARLRHVRHLSLQFSQNGTEIFADFKNFDHIVTL